MRYAYPALFEPAEEGGYNVSVPDIPGCFTCADSMPEAIRMAEDALSMMLASYEDDGETIPEARTLAEIRKDDSEVSYILADTDEWRKRFDSKAVKKTLSIPSWLNKKAEKAGVNFSQVLRDALAAIL